MLKIREVLVRNKMMVCRFWKISPSQKKKEREHKQLNYSNNVGYVSPFNANGNQRSFLTLLLTYTIIDTSFIENLIINKFL